jgi:putative transposase
LGFARLQAIDLRGEQLVRHGQLADLGLEGNDLGYYGFPDPHWRRLRTNNPLERIICEILVGPFPEGQSALNLAARLRHIAGTRWSTRRYLDMTPLRYEDLLSA